MNLILIYKMGYIPQGYKNINVYNKYFRVIYSGKNLINLMIFLILSSLIAYRFVEQCIKISDNEYNEIKTKKPTKDMMESFCLQIVEVGNELKFSFDIVDRGYILVVSVTDDMRHSVFAAFHNVNHNPLVGNVIPINKGYEKFVEDLTKRIHTGRDILPDFDEVFSRMDERKITTYHIINPVYFYSKLTLHLYEINNIYINNQEDLQIRSIFKFDFIPLVNFKSSIVNVKDGKDCIN